MVLAVIEPEGARGLPVYLTHFLGREFELDLLAGLLSDPTERVVTLVGPGGVGKTRLLVEAIPRLQDPSVDDVVFVDGSALDRPSLLLPRIVDLLGIDQTSDQMSGELLSERLAGRKVVLLLDNMEHLLAAAVDIAGLVRALPGLRVISTSRAPLHISGERILDVGPLKISGPIAGATELSVAGQLFVDRARKTGKVHEPAGEEIATIETICARLDGLPLAIELAAARLRVLSLQALQAVLTNQLSILTGGPVDTSARHQTLRAAIGWSFDLLSADEQRLLNELAVFSESFSLRGIEAVTTVPPSRVVDLLESLVDQALLLRTEDDPDGQPRFSLLSSIRDYALEQLRESGGEDDARVRHAAWCLRLSESLAPSLTGQGQQKAIVQLNRSASNIRQALEYMIAQRDQASALRMVAALQRYWLIRSQLVEARGMFEAALSLGKPEPSQIWGEALRAAAIIAETQYDSEAALTWNLQAIAIWEEMGDSGWAARSYIDLGNVYNTLGRFEDARVEFKKAVELADPQSDLRTHLVALGSIAITLMRQGKLVEADQKLAEVIPKLRTIGDHWLLATSLSNLGIVKQWLGQRSEARALFLESLQLRQELGDEYSVGVTLINLGGVEEDPEVARTLSIQALEIGLRLGATDLAAAAQVDLGAYAMDRGDPIAAADNYILALNGYASINDEVLQVAVMSLIAELIEKSDPAAAARLFGTVRTVQASHELEPAGPIAERAAAIEARLLRNLGQDAFQKAFDRGREAPLAEARVDALQAARGAGTGVLQIPVASGRPRENVFAGLTPRELDVLRLITAGKTDRQIADQLFITAKTANHHVTRILAKLECRNRAAATAIAFQHGLV